MTNNVYKLLNPLAVISAEEYQSRVNEVQIDPDKFPPIFFMINVNPFNNWCIEITDISFKDDVSGDLKIGYDVIRYPSGITEQIIESSRNQLSMLVSKIAIKIITDTQTLGT